MEMRLRVFLAALMTMALTSCNIHEQEKHYGVSDGEAVRVCFDFSVISDGTKTGADSGENAVNDISIFVYSDGILEASAHIENEMTAELTLVSGKRYNIYSLANSGKLELPMRESDLPDFRLAPSDVSPGNFPMSAVNVSKTFSAGSSLKVSLVRLVSKVRFRLDASGIPGFSVNSVRMMNIPLDIMPFSNGSAAASAGPGDYAGDVSGLLTGDSVDFYMLENCQGVLLPGNDDPWQKVPDNIPDKSHLCTYMEVTASLDGSSGLSGTAVYRFYLGQDNTSDFNIFRNTDNTVTLVVTEEGLDNVSWRIDNNELYPVPFPVVGVGEDGTIAYTDKNGMLTQMTVGTSYWRDVCYGNGRYVAVGWENNIAYSEDCVNWVNRQIHFTGADYYRISYLERAGKFLSASDGAMALSIRYTEDGESWYLANCQGSGESLKIIDFLDCGSKYIMLANWYSQSSYSARIFSSEDAVNWSNDPPAGIGSKELLDGAYACGRLVVVRDCTDSKYGSIGYTDTDLGQITYIPCKGMVFTQIVFFDGRFIAINPETKDCALSEDGTTWEFRKMSADYDFAYPDIKLYAAEGYGVVALYTSAPNPVIAVSLDGVKWTVADLPTSKNIMALAIMR